MPYLSVFFNRFPIALLVLALASILRAQSSGVPGQPVGILLKTGGSNLLHGSSEAKTAKAGEILFAGDRLTRLGEAGSFLYCPEKALITIAAGSEATFRADRLEVSTGRIVERKAVASCMLPQMVKVAVASLQIYGTSLVRADSDLLAAKLSTMSDSERTAFQAEWKVAETALLANPQNGAERSRAQEILAKYQIPPEALNQQPALSPSPTLELWSHLNSDRSGDLERAAIEAAKNSPVTAAGLYRELLFDAVDAIASGGPALSASAGRVRSALAIASPESTAWEAQLSRSTANPRQSFGANGAVAEILSRYIAAVSNPSPKAEQFETILSLSLAEGMELPSAAAWINLAAISIREGRPDAAPPLLELAQMVWRSWNHRAGLASTDFWTGAAYSASGKTELAAMAYRRAAEAVRDDAGMRSLRAAALSGLATEERRLSHAEAVPPLIESAILERQTIADTLTDPTRRSAELVRIESLQNELGDAWMAVKKYDQAGAAYRRAVDLGKTNLDSERERADSLLKTVAKQLDELRANPDSELKNSKVKIFHSMADLTLNALDGSAQARNNESARAEIAERRVELARSSGQREILIDALKDAARAYRRAGDLNRARQSAQEALAMSPSRPYRFEEELAAITADESDFGVAAQHYEQVLKLAEAPSVSANPMDKLESVQTTLGAHQGLAEIQMYQGKYSLAQSEYQKLSRSLLDVYAAGAPDQPDLEKWIGSEYARKPETSLIEAASRVHAVDIERRRKQAGTTASETERQRMQTAELVANAFRTVLTIGEANLLAWQNDLDGAAAAYEAAIQRMSDVAGGTQTTAGFSSAIARIERQRGNYAEAEKRVDAMLEQDRRGRDFGRLSATLAFSALLKLDQRKLADARSRAGEALATARASNSAWQVAAAQQILGRIETESDPPYLQDAELNLSAALNQFRRLGLPEHTATALTDVGALREKQGKDEEALASYREAVSISELLVNSLSRDVNGSVYRAGRQSRQTYDRLIRLLIRKGRGAEALHYLETSKSAALVESLAGANIAAGDPSLSNLFRSVREKQSEFVRAQQALTLEAGRPETQKSAARLEELKRAFLQKQNAYLAAVQEAQKADPQASAFMAIKATDAVAASKRLPAGSLLLEYFPDDNGLSIFALRSDRSPVVYHSPVKAAELNRLVETYRQGVLKQQADQAAGARLYNALIAPAQASMKGTDSLIFVPSGSLFDLPFQALGRVLPDGSTRYVIDDYAVSYLSAADQVRAGGSVHSRRTAVPLLALGDPDGSLPGAREELSALKRIFPAARTYIGSDVTLDRLTAAQDHARYVHLATHGVIDRRDPKNSYLLLNGAAGQVQRLTVQDVVEDRYRLSFAGTQLVTLSACETSLGNEDASSAYGSLSRAFARAGVPAVVASLWTVDDQAALATMKEFYRQLASGKPRPEALRQAELSLRRSAKYSNPWFWAPFIIMGR